MEIGTGTGYNTALLCHRLGDAHVTSIDIDPDPVADAREPLAALRYLPTLLAGDGARGASGNAPYDRIIATCAVSTIPQAGSTNSPRRAPSSPTSVATWPAASPSCTKPNPIPSPAAFPASRDLHVAARRRSQPPTRRRGIRHHHRPR
ncbi:MAG: methyltransferase [Pseudonocardiaceae bacterium]